MPTNERVVGFWRTRWPLFEEGLRSMNSGSVPATESENPHHNFICFTDSEVRTWSDAEAPRPKLPSMDL